MKTRNKILVDYAEWNKLVRETYDRPYNIQQQNGCRDRGIITLSVPDEPFDYENDTVPESVNGPDMGVSFEAWMARDPTQKLSDPDDQYEWSIGLWWDRNFYPDVSMVANDLHSRGLLDAGEYVIEIS